MNISKILKNIPDYTEFMTVEELDNSSRRLAKKFNGVELLDVGKSRLGRSILCLKIGDGKKKALLFAFPHPNEPIGSLTVEFLAQYLAENPNITKQLGYTWYLIKVIDPDGAVLNEGWFKGKFNPIKYAQNYYRPAPHEQIEWTFPINYKKLNFTKPPPETQALMRIFKEVKPLFMYSLHNAGFCGIYWYVSHNLKAMFPDLVNLVEKEGLPIHRGEPEAPYIKALSPAIYQLFGIQESYDFFEENGVMNPEELIKNGTSSDDYLKQITNNKGFTLVCEMPYFYDNALEDDSESNYGYREKRLEFFDNFKKVHEFAKSKFELIRKYCNKRSKIFTSVLDFIDEFEKRVEPEIQFTKISDEYKGNATIAQAFDLMVGNKYYTTLPVAMIARLCNEVATSCPDMKDKALQIKGELDLWVKKTIEDLLTKTNFKVIPIQKLVKIQVGSALIAMQNLVD